MQTVERIQPPIRMRFTPRSIRGRPGGPRRLLAVTLATFLIILIPNLSAQDNRVGEIVANLATGRVIFCVTHDAIIVAATSGGGEVGSHPPAVLPVSSGRIGVLLGAIDWSAPDTAKVTRLDSELPAAAANALRRPKQKPAQEPSEIEDLGVGMLEQIRPLVDQIHHKLDLSPDEPLVQLILVDYVQDYRPDPEFDRIAHSSREVSDALALIAAGNSTKAGSSPTSDFMRAAIPLAGGNEQNLVMAVLDMNRGFQWVLAPREPTPPGKTQAPSQPREPDAPSLRNRGPRPN